MVVMSSDASTSMVLVDGSSYLYRAFHALPDLKTSTGQPTGAIRGVLNMLRRLQKDQPEAQIIVVFDAKGKTFRDDLFEQYKANRAPMPDDLRQQVPPLYDLVKAMGLPLLVEPGVEADDVIGTLARQASAAGREVVISTGDKDMAQLVNAHVRLHDSMKDTWTDEAEVTRRFGVRPEQIVDYLALVGDKVDNIPGVPGCGPRTAAKWLGEWGDLEGVMAQAAGMKGKAGERLRESLDFLPLSKDLATIRTDLAFSSISDKDLKSRPEDIEALRALFEQLEFRSDLQKLADGAEETTGAETPAAPDSEYEQVTDTATLDDWIAAIAEAGEVAFDTETSALDVMKARLAGVSFGLPGKACYVPCAHEEDSPQIDTETLVARIRPLLEDPGILKIGQNLKYDINVMAHYGVAMQGVAHDTMLQSYVLNSTGTRHDMGSLAKKYLNRDTIPFEAVAGKGAKQVPFTRVTLDKATEYAAEDADVTLALHQTLWPELVRDDSLKRVYETIEMPLVPVLARMERTGTLIDADRLRAQSEEIRKKLDSLASRAFELADEAFNLASPRQLGQILFDKLGMPVKKKTATGQPSTAEDVLQELARDYPLPALVLEYRSLSKLQSTYTDRLPEQVNPDTGRVHTSYHQAVTSTGRLSSSDPNLQNIPVRTDEGRRIRQAFVAPAGYRLVSADYSQIELRIMAHFSGDRHMIAAFAEGQDIHRATAAEIFGMELEAVTNDQRRNAKAINFGLIYGMSAFGLSRQLGLGAKEAQDWIDRYFARYPGVRNYMDQVRARARETGYVETLLGRRIHLPEIRSGNPARRAGAERLAINAPVQGSAADIIKLAMIQLDQQLAAGHPGVRMVMQVHDELVLEVPEKQVEQVSRLLTDCMSGAMALDVPLEVEAGAGMNWDEAH
jgi:DNA polymerase-1